MGGVVIWCEKSESLDGNYWRSLIPLMLLSIYVHGGANTKYLVYYLQQQSDSSIKKKKK